MVLTKICERYEISFLGEWAETASGSSGSRESGRDE